MRLLTRLKIQWLRIMISGKHKILWLGVLRPCLGGARLPKDLERSPGGSDDSTPKHEIGPETVPSRGSLYGQAVEGGSRGTARHALRPNIAPDVELSYPSDNGSRSFGSLAPPIFHANSSVLSLPDVAPGGCRRRAEVWRSRSLRS
jgi:hypothetical protein